MDIQIRRLRPKYEGALDAYFPHVPTMPAYAGQSYAVGLAKELACIGAAPLHPESTDTLRTMSIPGFSRYMNPRAITMTRTSEGIVLKIEITRANDDGSCESHRAGPSWEVSQVRPDISWQDFERCTDTNGGEGEVKSCGYDGPPDVLIESVAEHTYKAVVLRAGCTAQDVRPAYRCVARLDSLARSLIDAGIVQVEKYYESDGGKEQ